MSIRLNYEESALRICIDRVEQGCLSGRLYGRRLSAPLSFFDVSDLILKVDALLDAQNFPQAFSQIRSFTEKSELEIPAVRERKELSDATSVEAAQGERATFSLQISSRQNATWQGDVDWLDGSPRQHFTSSLALVKLMAARLDF